MEALFGVDFFSTVDTIDLQGVSKGSDWLEQLSDLSDTRYAVVRAAPQPDAVLARLATATELEQLDLQGGRVENGLKCLSGFARLEQLCLAETRINDGELKCLTGLRSLEEWDVGYTHWL